MNAFVTLREIDSKAYCCRCEIVLYNIAKEMK